MRKNLAAARLAVLNQLEYRINYAIDAFVQPTLATCIEVALWMGLLSSMRVTTLGGFGREYYLAYALWTSFVARISTNWMYEFIMLDEIDSGRVNSVLVRPISFFEFYLSQFMGYKMVTAVFSFFIPVAACLILKVPMHLERIPLMLLLCTYYLIFAFTISFCVACMAFFMNRAHSLTVMKNLLMVAFTGEFIPLDLFPEPFKSVLMHLPFSSGVYLPVAFITGRIGLEQVLQGFVSVTYGLAVVGVFAAMIWRLGIRSYTGTGA